MNEMRPLRLAVGCSIGLLLVALMWPLATGQIFVRDDVAGFHLPVRYLYQQALLAGDSVLWTPSLYSGFYLFGEGQAGMAHPLHWFLYRCFPLTTALNLEIVASYLALLAGGALLLRRMSFAAPIAWFGGMVFAFSGSTLLHLMHVNAVAVIAHTPWLLLAADILMASEQRAARAMAFAGISVLLASQLLLGHPQYVSISWMAVGYLVLCSSGGPHRGRSLVLLSGAIVLGCAMAAIQVLPTLDVLRDSLHANLPADVQLQVSLDVRRDVFVFLSPGAVRFGLLHEFATYNGAFCTVALCWVGLRWRTMTRRRVALALVGLLVIGFVLSLGSAGGLYPLLAKLPGMNAFRAPARHIVLAHLALSGLAAIVLEDLWLLRERDEIVPLRTFYPLAIVAWLAILITFNAPSPTTGPWLMNPWLWVGLLVAVTALVILSMQGRKWALPALVALVALDQGLWGFGYIYDREGQGLATIESVMTAEPSPPARAGESVFQALVEGDRGNLVVLHGLKRSNGYAGLMPATELNPADPTTQRLGGVAWARSDGSWSRVEDPMPRARLLASWVQSSDAGRDVHTVNIHRTAIVRGPIGSLEGDPGVVRVVVDRPGRLVLDSAAEGRQLLVTTERFHVGWKVTVDDDAATTIPVFGDYLGVVVPAGAHRVQLRFAPESVAWGARISILGVAAAAGLTMLLAWTPRQHVARRANG